MAQLIGRINDLYADLPRYQGSLILMEMLSDIIRAATRLFYYKNYKIK
jgi:hypothetical protein